MSIQFSPCYYNWEILIWTSCLISILIKYDETVEIKVFSEFLLKNKNWE